MDKRHHGPHGSGSRRGEGKRCEPERPIAFLVSTSSSARSLRDQLGSPAYSYVFVVEALGPVLERFGTWRLIDHPESRLAFAARQAEAEGYRAVHLAVNPLQDVYLSPALPNILFPFWEFPDIPARSFGNDLRQNWKQACRPAALIITACEFTAEAFRSANVRAPIAVVPVPLSPEAFELPDWNPSRAWTLTCRHECLGETPADESPLPAVEEASDVVPRTFRPDVGLMARDAFRRVHPWIDPETVGKLTRLKRWMAEASRQSPVKLLYATARDGYRAHFKRWLSPYAMQRITELKRKALAMVGREPHVVPDPPLPSFELTLGGLVYLTIFNLGDLRKNYADILSAYLVALKDRDDATLVIKLVTNKVREHHEAGILRSRYESMGLRHRCRVVVITEFLNDAQMDELFRVATYYVNASHAEGACLPLMRALAGGSPAIAPNHTAMADYMDDAIGFVPSSSLEPTHWPHDPEQRLETFRHRLSWSDLRDAFIESAEVATSDPNRYAAMSRAARARLRAHASQDAAATALGQALESLAETPAGAFEWA